MHQAKRSRRQFLGAAGTATVAWCCGDHLSAAAIPSAPSTLRNAPLVDVAAGLQIHPRENWGADLPPRRSMAPEDVKFLLVHHTASSNFPADIRSVIRGVYQFHTGSAKRWPDVAYNFFVGPDGSVWEGRAGSLAGAVVADATGGNQGFSQLVCLIGNHVSAPPTAAAQTSLVRTLAWLAGQHDLNTYADASTTFVSRGSNKFRPGTVITTPIVSAHRDVTYTACPGDAAVALLPAWRRRVFDELSATWSTVGLQRAQRSGLIEP